MTFNASRTDSHRLLGEAMVDEASKATMLKQLSKEVLAAHMSGASEVVFKPSDGSALSGAFFSLPATEQDQMVRAFESRGYLARREFCKEETLALFWF